MSQNPVSLPVQTLDPARLAALINAALDTLRTAFAGTSAPAAPESPQSWFDTSTSPWKWKIYDGAQWVTLGALDPTSHVWTSQPLPGGAGDANKFVGTDPDGTTLILIRGLLVPLPAGAADYGKVPQINAAGSAYELAGPPRITNLLVGGRSSTNPWQLGSSIGPISNGTAYTADQWEGQASGAGSSLTVSRQSGALIPFNRFRLQRTAGNTATGQLAFGQSLVVEACFGLQGKQITLSFSASAGANYSGGALTSRIATGTGGNTSSLRAGFTGQSSSDQSNTIGATQARFKQTVTVPSNATQVAVAFLWTPSGTAGTNDYVDLEDIKLEVGSAATAYDIEDYRQALLRCHYFLQLVNIGHFQLINTTTTDFTGTVPLIARMRTAPSASLVGTCRLNDYSAAYNISSLISYQSDGVAAATVRVRIGSSYSGFQPLFFSAGQIQFDARL